MHDPNAWTPRPMPTNDTMEGRYVHVGGWDRKRDQHAIWNALGGDEGADHAIRYYGWPLLGDAETFGAKMQSVIDDGDWVCCTFTLPDADTPSGMASYMRTDTANGVTEVGCVAHGSGLAGTRAAVEAHYLMARRVFDELGYRRYEWKLNDRNEASHRAARRLGFTFEGVFRQHQVVRDGNRDTAWYAMIDRDWPEIRAGFEAWLDPTNFDAEGHQRKRLEECRDV